MKLINRVRGFVKRELQRIKAGLSGRECVHFLHIGKTGGTAVKHALLSGKSSRYVIFTHSHAFTLKDVPAGEKVFFFLRDPVSRFVSGFYSRQRQGRPRYFTPWSKDEKAAFEQFHTPDQLAAALSSSDERRKKAAERAMTSIEHVRDSFWKWFDNEEYFRSRTSDILFIGFQEHLSEDFKILKKKLGLSEYAQLPSADINAHRTPANANAILKNDSVTTLKKWYKSDYEFIELCRTIRKRPVYPQIPREIRPLRKRK